MKLFYPGDDGIVKRWDGVNSTPLPQRKGGLLGIHAAPDPATLQIIIGLRFPSLLASSKLTFQLTGAWSRSRRSFTWTLERALHISGFSCPHLPCPMLEGGAWARL